MEQENKRIVVGVDGSDSSKAALVYAYNEAKFHGCDLDIIYVWRSPASYYPYPVVSLSEEKFFQGAKEFVKGFVDEVLSTELEVNASIKIIEGSPGPVLVEQSQNALLLVVGVKGHDLLNRLLVGSVSRYVIAHSLCPVVVVRYLQQEVEKRKEVEK
jgi:nucleotide-binding universal stress UspA family protein